MDKEQKTNSKPRKPRPPIAPGEYVVKRKAVIAALLGVEVQELMTSQEVADLLGLSKVSVCKYERMGLLKKHGKGKGRSFYLRTEIEHIARNYEQAIKT